MISWCFSPSLNEIYDHINEYCFVMGDGGICELYTSSYVGLYTQSPTSMVMENSIAVWGLRDFI